MSNPAPGPTSVEELEVQAEAESFLERQDALEALARRAAGGDLPERILQILARHLEDPTDAVVETAQRLLAGAGARERPAVYALGAFRKAAQAEVGPLDPELLRGLQALAPRLSGLPLEVLAGILLGWHPRVLAHQPQAAEALEDTMGAKVPRLVGREVEVVGRLRFRRVAVESLRPA